MLSRCGDDDFNRSLPVENPMSSTDESLLNAVGCLSHLQKRTGYVLE